MAKRVVLVVVALLLIAGVLCIVVFNINGGPAPKESREEQAAMLIVEDLEESWAANEAAAADAYEGKDYRFTGTVTNVSKDGTVQLMQENSSSYVYADCLEGAENLSVGDSITVIGQLDLDSGIHLRFPFIASES